MKAWRTRAADDGPKRLTLEDKPSYKNAKALVAIFAGVVALCIALFELGGKVKPTPKQALVNVEILIDASAQSLSPLDGTVKAEVIRLSIDESLQVLSDNDNIGLRAFGGSCTSGSRELVPLGVGNQGKLRSATRSVSFEGERNLVKGLADATADFNDAARFTDKAKRIVVITGGGDTCLPASLALAEFKRRLQDTGVEADVRVIGVGIPLAQRQDLQKLAESVGGKASFADSLSELLILMRTAVAGAAAIPSPAGSGASAATPLAIAKAAPLAPAPNAPIEAANAGATRTEAAAKSPVAAIPAPLPPLPPGNALQTIVTSQDLAWLWDDITPEMRADHRWWLIPRAFKVEQMPGDLVAWNTLFWLPRLQGQRLQLRYVRSIATRTFAVVVSRDSRLSLGYLRPLEAIVMGPEMSDFVRLKFSPSSVPVRKYESTSAAIQAVEASTSVVGIVPSYDLKTRPAKLRVLEERFPDPDNDLAVFVLPGSYDVQTLVLGIDALLSLETKRAIERHGYEVRK